MAGECEGLLRQSGGHEAAAAACYMFSDGLEQSKGDEDDLERILRSIASSGEIRICASNRPRRMHERFRKDQSVCLIALRCER
jgi:hypothetical protein